MLLVLQLNNWSDGILANLFDFKTSNLKVELDEDNGQNPGRYKLAFDWKLYQYSGSGFIHFSGEKLILDNEFGNNFSRLDMKEGFSTPGYLGGQYCALYNDPKLEIVFQSILNNNRTDIERMVKEI